MIVFCCVLSASNKARDDDDDDDDDRISCTHTDKQTNRQTDREYHLCNFVGRSNNEKIKHKNH